MTNTATQPRFTISLDTVTSRHASLRTWRARCVNRAGTTEFVLAVKNVAEPGAIVTGSIWAVRVSNPIPLISELLGTFPLDPTSIKLSVGARDALPFSGELMGRFLDWRKDAGPGTIPFSPASPGDWWVASCALATGGKFTLGINEIESAAVLLPTDPTSVIALVSGLLGLWLTPETTAPTGGAA